MKGRFLIAILAVAAACCSQPASRESFMFREKAEYGDTYSFSLDLSDSTVSYALSFLARRERAPFGTFPNDDILLDLRWFSPSDSIFADTTFVKMADVTGQTYYTEDFITLYKPDLDFQESGEWRVKAKVVNNPESIRGMGVILKRIDGTR